jgi:hypothetical protein
VKVRRAAFALTGAAVAVTELTACAPTKPLAAHVSASSREAVAQAEVAAPSPTASAVAANAGHLCEAAFPAGKVLAWSSAVVGQLREFHYGGPTPHYPLASVFPDLDVDTPAAWCETKPTSDTVCWSVVASGEKPVTVIGGQTGPADALPTGELIGPPQPP